MAERGRFELPVACATTDFESVILLFLLVSPYFIYPHKPLTYLTLCHRIIKYSFTPFHPITHLKVAQKVAHDSRLPRKTTDLKSIVPEEP